jgi:hypothetical protein
LVAQYDLISDISTQTLHITQVRLKLLFWTGDYPALGKTASMSHQGLMCCHWCLEPMRYDKGLQRTLCGDCRRRLPDEHHFRLTAQYGEADRRLPYMLRTHDMTVLQGELCDKFDQDNGTRWKKPPQRHPSHKTGVKCGCPLRFLVDFDIILDIMPDMMHIVKGIMQGHIVPLMKGNRAPTVPKPPKPPKNEPKPPSNDLTEARHDRAAAEAKEAYETKMLEYETQTLPAFYRALRTGTAWQLTQARQTEFDERPASLVKCPTGWMNSSWRPMTATGRMKCNDWHRMLMFGAEYLFEGFIPAGEMWTAFTSIAAAYRAVVGAECDSSDDQQETEDAEAAIAALDLRVTEAVCQLMNVLPETERASIIHIFMHVPAAIRRWNSVRNFWCYAAERLVAYVRMPSARAVGCVCALPFN